MNQTFNHWELNPTTNQVDFFYDDIEETQLPLCDDCGAEMVEEPIYLGNPGLFTMYDDVKMVCKQCYIDGCNN